MIASKIFDQLSIVSILDAWKPSSKKIVFTNGCYDILHAGHVSYLEQAKSLGDVLIVGVNTDDSIRRLKGSNRPIVGCEERMQVLAALESVDAVVAFDEDTPLELIKLINPNILVKGGDWPKDKIVGADHVLSYGGEVLSLSFVEGNSTTSIIEKILTVYK